MKINASALVPVLCAFLWSGFSLTAQNCYYKHLKGTIGKSPVTMQLHGNGILGYYDGDTYKEGEAFSGTYTYNKYQEPINFQGYRTSTGMIELNEYYADESTGQFNGNFDSEGNFNGVWKNAEETLIIPFSLRESYPDGTVALETYCRSDSMKLFETMEFSPEAKNYMQWLWPAKTTSESTKTFLEKAIPAAMLMDSVAPTVQSPEMLYMVDKNTFFEAYRYDMSEIRQDDSTVAEYPYMYSYDQQTALRVLWNEDYRLSLGYELYLYTGGAHGNYATSYLSYDLKSERALLLNDVFLPGFEDPLNALLEAAVRKKFQLTEEQALTEVLFDDGISFNENFYLTGKGIVFAYVPYEIAAYAVGQIELFIPFVEIGALLQPGIADL